MITGVAWIGASFYFVWLENNLNRVNPRDGLAGDLWAIHGGGIYHLQKYKLAPPSMPEHLHWFKWEAYFTWMSGMVLMMLVFYLHPTLYLIAPGSDMAPSAAIVTGLGSIVLGYMVYHLLCDSALGKAPVTLSFVLFMLLVAAGYGFSTIFSGRAAYLHVGAIIGTIMVGNVFFTIMPAQRALVKAIEEGRTPDPALPAKGLLRSRHNNYFTLPVLFIMISNHFPSTYGNQYNWLILAGIGVIAVMVRHYFNTRQQSQQYAWTLPAAALGMICLAYVTGPKPAPASVTAAPASDVAVNPIAIIGTEAGAIAASRPEMTSAASTTVTFAAVQSIVNERCTSCHAAKPSSPLFSAPPGGVIFDTPQQIQAFAPRIHAQAVASQIMPLGNMTKMTPEERELLGAWIVAGAKLD
jgi:uncharacterized membrane protein